MSDRPSTIKDAELAYYAGNQWPYDATDEQMNSDDDFEESPPPTWQMKAARAVVNDLTDRRGIKRGFENVDEDVRADIVKTLAMIISVAYEADQTSGEGEEVTA